MTTLHSLATGAIRSGRTEPAVFVDVKSAYDTVPHAAVVARLRQLGVSKPLVQWVLRFLQDRCFRTTFRGVASEWMRTTRGLPQGSVLAPLLFIIWFDVIVPRLERCGVLPQLVADDLLLVVKSSAAVEVKLQQLEMALYALTQWAQGQHVKFQLKKSGVIFFRRKGAPLPDDDQRAMLTLQGQQVFTVSQYKYLGVMFDEHLTFASHLATVRSKISSMCSRLRLITSAYGACYPSPKLAVALIKSLVLPSAAWGCAIWGIANQSALHHLDVQHAFLLSLPLGVAGVAAHEAVLAEVGVMPMRTVFAQAVLSLASHFALNPSLVSSRIVADGYGPPEFVADPVYDRRLFAEQLFITRSELKLEVEAPVHPDGMASLPVPEAQSVIKQRLAEAALALWVARRDPVIHEYLPQGRGPHVYLQVDSLESRVARSCLRFKRLRTNAWKAQAGLQDDSLCSWPACAAAGISDDCHHVLFSCPRFRSVRNESIARLTLLQLPHTPLSFLGHIPAGLSRTKAREFLLAARSFLGSVYSVYCVR